jgi:Apea-like HEPN
LMHGSPAENTEITHKISHRAGWLLGASGSERKRIAKSVKRAYSFRSKAVHTGQLPVIRTSEEYEIRQEQFGECEAIIGRLIGRLLDGWPNWEDVTLGYPGSAD